MYHSRSDKIIVISSYLFLVLPIVIFLFGWLRLFFAVITTLLLLIGLYFTLKEFSYKNIGKIFDTKFIMICFFIVCVWVFFSGIGGFGYQNWDFIFRNAVFRDLINHKWPVVYDYTNDPIMNASIGDRGALVYFFSYWLPASLVGKILGWKIANLFLFIWTIIGVTLCLLLICRYVEKASILIVLSFIFFSGLDILGTIIINFKNFMTDATINDRFSLIQFFKDLFLFILGTNSLEWWAGYRLFHYSSIMGQLFWVFNSSVPAWLVTILLLNQKESRGLLFTFVLILFFAPFPAIGLFPYLLYKIISLNIENLRMKSLQKKLINLFYRISSFQNVLSATILSVVIINFYLLRKGFQDHGFIFNRDDFSLYTLYSYFLFCFCEFFIFWLLTYRWKQRNLLMIITVVLLAIIPLYSYGLSNDFVMRVSIPPLLVLYITGINNLIENNDFGKKMATGKILLLIFIIFIMVLSPMREILRSRDKIVSNAGFPLYNDSIVSFDYSMGSDNIVFINNFIVEYPGQSLLFRYH